MSLIEKIDAEIEKLWKDDDGRGSNTVPTIVLGLERAKEIILSEQAETSKEIKNLQSNRDYWKAEALKHCAKLGEIKLLVGRSNG